MIAGTEGVDFAWDRPNLDQLWSAGKRFVCRYLAFLPNGKVLSAGEREALHRKGFGIVLNWEQAAGDMLKGFSTGAAHAREALRQATALGAPPTVPIYFSCDVDTTAAQRVAVAAYLDGCASVLGHARVGVYGEADIIDAMLPAHAVWGWQTYAWSGGRVSAEAHFLQYRNGVVLAGATLDLDRMLKDDIGAWMPITPERLRREQMQILVDGFQPNPAQVFLADGMVRRPVPPEWIGADGNGPITNTQVHQAGLLGNLGNGGKVFHSGGDPDVWGVLITQPAAHLTMNVTGTLTAES